MKKQEMHLENESIKRALEEQASQNEMNNTFLYKPSLKDYSVSQGSNHYRHSSMGDINHTKLL